MEQDLVSLGDGIKVSKPLQFRKKLRRGEDVHASLSHEGVLAIYSFNKKHAIQLTNFMTGEQLDVPVEGFSNMAFYDKKILVLTQDLGLREALVEDLFVEPSTDTLNVVGNVRLSCDACTSIVHSTRVLYYTSSYSQLYKYNVDTRDNRIISTEKKVKSIASCGGLDLGVELVFQDWDYGRAYALEADDTITFISEAGKDTFLTDVLPSDEKSPVSPRAKFSCVQNSLFKTSEYILLKDARAALDSSIKLENYSSLIRIMNDVFLCYDCSSGNWVLCRIIVP